MSGPPAAEVLAVGAELLSGDVVDTNSAAVARALRDVGVALRQVTTVPDDAGVIEQLAREALGRSAIVVVTGGLGPTSDDLTEAALTAAFGPPERRLPNPVGSADGLAYRRGGHVLYALPGVPHEMAALLAGAVVPDVVAGFPAREQVALLVLRCAGAAEADLGRRVDAALAGSGVAGVAAAYLASDAEVLVKLRAAGGSAAEALAEVAPRVREVLGADCYAEGETSLAATVVSRLRVLGATVATGESLTAGLVSARLADVPGASAVLRGGVTAYATELKSRLLGVQPAVLADGGVVSERTAAAMATGARELAGADWGLATTGVAGPEPQDGHPAGTVCLGVAGPEGVTTRLLRLPDGGRAWLRAASTTLALDLLRRTVSRL